MLKVLLKGDGIMPGKGTPDSAAYDIYAPHDVYLLPHTQVMVDTGVVIDLEDLGKDYDVILLPRSSSAKAGYEIANKVALIDFDYRGVNDTLKVVIRFTNPNIFTTVMVDGIPERKLLFCREVLHFARGEAICQMVIRKHYNEPIELVDESDWGNHTDRGGFGTTTLKQTAPYKS